MGKLILAADDAGYTYFNPFNPRNP